MCVASYWLSPLSRYRLWQQNTLEWVGLWLPGLGKDLPVDEGLLVQEELAAGMARAALAMIAARAVRSIYILRSWPHRALRILDGGPAADETIHQLRRDYEVYCDLRRIAGSGNPRAATLEKRSVFRLVAVQQIVTALEQGNGGRDTWAASPAFRQWLTRKSMRLQSSLMCEDTFNIQKNSSVVKSKRRYMVPQKAAVVALDKKALV